VPGTWKAAGTKNSSAARKLTALSSFYGWCARRGHVRANPVAGLARPAVDYDASATPGLTRDQAIALLATTLLYTEARVSELLAADIGPRRRPRPPELMQGPSSAGVTPGWARGQVDSSNNSTAQR
jgi:hypothetical protein